MPEFEIRRKDLLARIGRLKTKGGTVETPVFLPVINMKKQSVSPRQLWEEFGCKMLITNAYLMMKNQPETTLKVGIHKFLDFPGTIMTDSGAYQILKYGKVDVTPSKIIEFQEEIGTDIATILDVPTGWKSSKSQARQTVEETIKRAKNLANLKKRNDLAWVGPVQGGHFLDLVAKSAYEMGQLPFEIYALGSPTPIMERYLFSTLVDMIIAAKTNLPPNRPLHLFGAGHPFMFALAVSLGCDLFDSAAYHLFARESRYLTSRGTVHLDKLEYLPCSCPVCAKKNIFDLREMPPEEIEKELTKHNLNVCFSEIRVIKQAIIEGRLWELLQMRAHGHPSLLQALKRLKKHAEYIEKQSPVTKRSGLFFFSSLDLIRPEVIRHEKRLIERYVPPKQCSVLLLFPNFNRRQSETRKLHKKAFEKALGHLKVNEVSVHVCTYSPPFGVIPLELEGVYPLNQYEYAYPPDLDTVEHLARKIVEYIEVKNYPKTVLFSGTDKWQEKVADICQNAIAEKGRHFEVLSLS